MIGYIVCSIIICIIVVIAKLEYDVSYKRLKEQLSDLRIDYKKLDDDYYNIMCTIGSMADFEIKETKYLCLERGNVSAIRVLSKTKHGTWNASIDDRLLEIEEDYLKGMIVHYVRTSKLKRDRENNRLAY